MNLTNNSINTSYDEVMSESTSIRRTLSFASDTLGYSPHPTSTYYTNKSYLLDVIMKKLNISDEDLNKDTSWIKAKVRDLKLDEVLN